MATLAWLALLGATCLVAVPALVFVAECIAAVLPRRQAVASTGGVRPPVAIVIPAHDEELGISVTVQNVLEQMKPGDRLLVVADNCTDATAARAREAGAEVVERNDPIHRGKGFALDFGVTRLCDQPPAAIVFIDADCTLLEGALDKIARLAIETGRPVQASYLIQTRGDQKIAFGIPEFAFLVKNHVRPRGLLNLGLPCQLTGSGMAMPWEMAAHIRHAGAAVVEDMKLGLDLAAAGHFPIFCEDAGVRSYFPESADGAATQRERWEGGHLGMLASGLRRLAATRTLSMPYAAMVLDVMVPPLAFLVLLVAALTGLSALAALFGIGLLPLALNAGLVAALTGSILLAWSSFGRQVLPARSLLSAPRYAFGKIALYGRILLDGPERTWVRTARGDSRDEVLPMITSQPSRLD